jgi:hypothetical protein
LLFIKINIFEHTHAPKIVHILLIILAALYTIHLRPWQCGVDVIKGEIKNPIIVFGTHSLIYK